MRYKSVPGVAGWVNGERTALVMGVAADLVQAVEKPYLRRERLKMTSNAANASRKPSSTTMVDFRWQAIVAAAVGIPVMVWG